jgi:CspA family cold shock protein
MQSDVHLTGHPAPVAVDWRLAASTDSSVESDASVSTSAHEEVYFVATGTVKRIVTDRGFGFIADDQGKEHFFHLSGLAAGVSIESLREGDKVTFETERSDRGPRATNVALAE